MLDRTNVVYRYDGSFNGFLCCVFECFRKKHFPAAIESWDQEQETLFPVYMVETEKEKAVRLKRTVSERISEKAFQLVRLSFLTCLPEKELHILRFLESGFQYGRSVMDMLTLDCVSVLQKAGKNLTGEAHLLCGFLRFTDTGQALTAVIEPKNYVLPLLVRHFCSRFPQEPFLIYDKTHKMALVHCPPDSAILPLEALELPEPGEEERKYRSLWKLFYNTVSIEERYNPKCRMTHMPKRYWKQMTEFQQDGTQIQDTLPPSPFQKSLGGKARGQD